MFNSQIPAYYQALSPRNQELLHKVESSIQSLDIVLLELTEYEASIQDLKNEIQQTVRDINRLHYQILRSLS